MSDPEADLQRFAEQGTVRQNLPVSARKNEEVKRSVSVMSSPSSPSPAKAKASPSSSGIPIEFFCYVNGAPGKITLLAQNNPEPL